MEHAWNQQEWPYEAADFSTFEQRLVTCNRLLSKYLEADKTPPGEPFKLTASVGKKGRIHVQWLAGAGAAPLGYRLYRSDSPDGGQWEPIGGELPASVEQFLDEPGDAEKPFYYTIEAFNERGSSRRTPPAMGRSGSGIAKLNSYEPFGDYRSTAKLAQENAGTGWKSPWSVNEGEALISLRSNGLNYQGLTTSGGALRVAPVQPKEGFSLSREIDGQIGSMRRRCG